MSTDSRAPAGASPNASQHGANPSASERDAHAPAAPATAGAHQAPHTAGAPPAPDPAAGASPQPWTLRVRGKTRRQRSLRAVAKNPWLWVATVAALTVGFAGRTAYDVIFNNDRDAYVHALLRARQSQADPAVAVRAQPGTESAVPNPPPGSPAAGSAGIAGTAAVPLAASVSSSSAGPAAGGNALATAATINAQPAPTAPAYVDTGAASLSPALPTAAMVQRSFADPGYAASQAASEAMAPRSRHRRHGSGVLAQRQAPLFTQPPGAVAPEGTAAPGMGVYGSEASLGDGEAIEPGNAPLHLAPGVSRPRRPARNEAVAARERAPAAPAPAAPARHRREGGPIPNVIDALRNVFDDISSRHVVLIKPEDKNRP